MTGGGRAAALDPRSAVVLLVCGIVAVMVAMGALRVGAYPFGTSWPELSDEDHADIRAALRNFEQVARPLAVAEEPD